MKSGQYITITHNDAIIMDSNVLYGVSMHEGVSKILSLKIGENLEKEISSKLKEAQAEAQIHKDNQFQPAEEPSSL